MNDVDVLRTISVEAFRRPTHRPGQSANRQQSSDTSPPGAKSGARRAAPRLFSCARHAGADRCYRVVVGDDSACVKLTSGARADFNLSAEGPLRRACDVGGRNRVAHSRHRFDVVGAVSVVRDDNIESTSQSRSCGRAHAHLGRDAADRWPLHRARIEKRSEPRAVKSIVGAFPDH